jgi:hypothetical protein
MPRRDADDAKADFDGGAVEQQPGDGAQRRFERERRRPDHLPPLEMELGDRSPHHVHLSGAGEHDRPAMTGAGELPDDAEAGLAIVLRSRRRVGHDDDLRADRGVNRFGGGEHGAEIVHRTRLLDVERLSARDCAGWIDEPYFAYAVAHGKSLRYGPAQRAGPDDRDESHWSRLF